MLPGYPDDGPPSLGGIRSITASRQTSMYRLYSTVLYCPLWRTQTPLMGFMKGVNIFNDAPFALPVAGVQWALRCERTLAVIRGIDPRRRGDPGG